jgi:hypothetical protein
VVAWRIAESQGYLLLEHAATTTCAISARAARQCGSRPSMPHTPSSLINLHGDP